MSSFDLDEIERTLKTARAAVDEFPSYERELKYKYLQSFYSEAYLSGSEWYVGPSIEHYIRTQHTSRIFEIDHKLQLLFKILDNNMFPPERV